MLLGVVRFGGVVLHRMGCDGDNGGFKVLVDGWVGGWVRRSWGG